MFAAIFNKSISVSDVPSNIKLNPALTNPLVPFAYSFSPLVEETSIDTVVLNLKGSGLIFGSFFEAGRLILDKANDANLKINVAISRDIDAAIHLCRNREGLTVVRVGAEESELAELPIDCIDNNLAGIDSKSFNEILETLRIWGIHKFIDFARLPEIGVVERLGQEGRRIQRITKGNHFRHLCHHEITPEFSQSLELEHSLIEIEPLTFYLSRLINQNIASLLALGMATNEVTLNLRLVSSQVYRLRISLPVATSDSKTLLKLLLLRIENDPPQAAVKGISIEFNPVKPRSLQSGLFTQQYPEPDKLELTIARIENLVGKDNIGSPEILNSNRPDSFKVVKFTGHLSHPRKTYRNELRKPLLAFRRFRPRIPLNVRTVQGRPVKIESCSAEGRKLVGKITRLSGPWRATGEWWNKESWAADEWDLAVSDKSNSEILCRISRDIAGDVWFAEGVYD